MCYNLNLRVSIHGGTPIAGWLVVENPMNIDVLRGTPISGNRQICSPDAPCIDYLPTTKMAQM